MNVSTLAKSKDPIFNKCMLFLMTDSSTSVMTQTGSLPGIDSLLDVLVSQLTVHLPCARSRPSRFNPSLNSTLSQ